MSVLLDDLRNALATGQAAMVVGAGVSVAASGGAAVAGWRGLLEDGIARCVDVADVPAGWADLQNAQLDLEDLESWLAVAEQVTVRLGGRRGGEFRRWLRETVGELAIDDRGAGLVDALVGVGVPVCTTNYDGLLEQVTGWAAVSWRDGAETQRVLRADDDGIVHLHGYWSDPESVILGVRSYDTVLADGSAQGMLRALATMRSLVLVGFGAGLDDPNFSALRSWMAETLANSEYRHFRLVRGCERASVFAEHGEAERIVPVVYGDDYPDLEPFLRALRPSSRSARGATERAPATSARPVLPAPRTCFGRQEIVDGLVEIMCDVDPLPVAVLGPPGIGKSAVALAAAHDPRALDRFQSRRWWVRCDGALEASGLIADIAATLGLDLAGDLYPAVIGELGAGPSLLVLDNAETPWGRDMAATEELLARLASVPELALVCSFRGSERPLGPRWADPVSIPPLAMAAAEQVFLAAAGSRFADDPQLVGLLADLDGMAIAIELLGRLAQSEPDLSGLRRRWNRRRTDLLSAGTNPDRHLSVAVSFDLSIESTRLSDASRSLLSVLAHLPDGVVAADLTDLFPDGDDAGAGLRRAGLAFDEAERLRVLKPIRDHVAAHYPPRPEHVRRASGHYVTLARTLGPAIGTDVGASAASILLANAANLSWAISTALDAEDAVAGIDAALSLTSLGRFAGVPIESLTHRAEQRARELNDRARHARAVFHAGLLAESRSDHDAARERFEQALPLYQRVGDVLGEANCINSLGDIALARSDHDAARGRFEQALPLYQRVGAVLGEANCIKSLGTIALARSDHDAARERFEQALPLYQRVGDVLGEANCIKSLGDIALARSDHDAARERFEQALPLYRAISEPYSIGSVFRNLAVVSRDAEERRNHIEAARAAWLQIGRHDLIASLDKLSDQGDP